MDFESKKLENKFNTLKFTIDNVNRYLHKNLDTILIKYLKFPNRINDKNRLKEYKGILNNVEREIQGIYKHVCNKITIKLPENLRIIEGYIYTNIKEIKFFYNYEEKLHYDCLIGQLKNNIYFLFEGTEYIEYEDSFEDDNDYNGKRFIKTFLYIRTNFVIIYSNNINKIYEYLLENTSDKNSNRNKLIKFLRPFFYFKKID